MVISLDANTLLKKKMAAPYFAAKSKAFIALSSIYVKLQVDTKTRRRPSIVGSGRKEKIHEME